jgi:dolichol-phosphate mannosyltransferase
VNASSRALVVLPTYNERGHITDVIDRLIAAVGPEVEVMVVDDRSPDRTADAVRAHPAFDRITLLERPSKLGLASAYLDAFQKALDAEYTAIVQMDADLSHDPADVPRLLEALDDADLVIGSRYIPGGRIENWSTLRRTLSRAGNLYARAWCGWALRDATSGLRAFKAGAIRAAEFASVTSEGYAFQIEMAYRVARAGGVVHEIPITFVERRKGKSKLSRGIVLEALVRVPGWGLRYRFTRGAS